jgi:signal transduction histidine kinase
MCIIGSVTSGVIHDINNANFILLNAQIIAAAWEDSIEILEKYYDENGDFTIGGLPFSEMRHNIPKLSEGIVDASRRIRDIVGNLRSMVKHDMPDGPVAFDPNLSVRSAVTIMNHYISKTTDNFSVEYADSLPHITGSPQRIAQAAANLLHNALSSLRDKSAAVSICTRLDEADGRIVIEVRDEGVGLDQSVLDHFGEPFFTTSSNPCVGLGLYVTNEIVKSHGGVLNIKTTPGKGTVVEIRMTGVQRQEQ